MTTIRSDSITFDTSKTPWMDVANAQLNKGVRERKTFKHFKHLVHVEKAQQQAQPRYHLLDWDKLQRASQKQMTALAGSVATTGVQVGNPEVTKYFRDLKTDPAYSGKSYPVATVTETSEGWQVTSWCAAFVNWCLTEAHVPHLGYATAASWLRFGTPLATPLYGCITVFAPLADTGSTTGHVGFFTGHKGDRLLVVGGNQHGEVRESSFPRKKAVGYRWPTSFNYYAGKSMVA